MVNLMFPKVGAFASVVHDLFLIPAITIAGTREYDQISLRLDTDSIVEKRGIYGENDVVHTKVDGIVYYDPIVGKYVSSATAQYPFSYTATCREGNLVYQAPAKFGLLSPGARRVRTRALFGTPSIIIAVAEDGCSWYELTAHTTWSIFVASFYRHEIIGTANNGSWLRLRTTRMKSLPGSAPFDLDTHDYTYSEVEQYFNDLISQNDYVGPYETGYSLRKVDMNPLISPSELISYVKVYPYQNVGDNFLVSPVHWGSLAHEASRTARCNQVNMIAFLRDLRHPSSLIPKLRNLRKLKSWANAYLSVKYGVLPTISDIQNIVAAVKKIGPYLDRNGYEVFTASHRDSFDGVSGFYQLEQHLKLAVAKEDDDLDRIVTTLENAGFWPDLQTIWDLVPYSFAIDWLVNIGELLARIDSRERLQRFNIRYVTMSLKQSVTLDMSSGDTTVPLTGKLTVVHYRRWVTDHCPVPPLSLEPTSTVSDHWLEAGALIIQRRK